MRLSIHMKSLTVTSAIALTLAFPPGHAAAVHKPQGFNAVATITACRGDSLTLGFRIGPASGAANRRAVRRAKRAVRRARLRMRFEAVPLYGQPRRSRQLKLGRTTNARRFVRLSELPAQTYGGVVRYRWVRGSRSVLSGFVRTRKARVAGRKGSASCSLRVGRRPVDTQPPFITPIPSDFGWKRGPLTVHLYAVDDLSGVALVGSRLDGGPFQRGRTVTVSGEGTHRLEYVARDAAGNQAGPAAVTLRVDQNPPTRPVVTAPSGTTSDTTPQVAWGASSDSGSGVWAYLAVVRDSEGVIVWSRGVGASVTSATVDTELASGSYTAEVTAYDGTQPQPFWSTGTRVFTVAEG